MGIEAHRYDPTLIKSLKIQAIQKVSTLFGLRDSLPFPPVNWRSPITAI
jgi:hypothetical protein